MVQRESILDVLPGSRLFLLGNEAIARGAIEAGVGFVATYPGTPSSEVGDALSRISSEGGFYFEFSVNEKVATEMAYAASISGIRSFVFMKHVGMNVAADAIMSIAYAGTGAGMVIMTADDPSMYSSQNEQDNRHYAELSHLPMYEPSNPQEAKNCVVEAFNLSEKLKVPVILRTTTRVSHQRGVVTVGDRPIPVTKGRFRKGEEKFLTLPSSSVHLRKELDSKMEEALAYSNQTPMNRVEGNGRSTIGFITSGEAYNCLSDVIAEHSIVADVFKLSFTNPLPMEKLREFLSSHDSVFIVEELDPYLEKNAREIAQMHSLRTVIHGKMDGIFPLAYEYTPDIVARSLSGALGIRVQERENLDAGSALPPRPPVLCPGCPHRATYFVVNRAVKMSGMSDVVYSSDIGCYSLGAYEPFNEADVMLEMGSSIGVGSGLSKATGKRVISFIGDSTFFHAGLPPLINAIRNGSRLTVVVMDNGTTAMTGQQINPGVERNGMGEESRPILIENVVKSLGITDVFVADPYDLRGFLPVVIRALKTDGVSVIVSRRECAILVDRRNRKAGTEEVFVVDQDKCGLCMNCVENFSCPAISIVEGRVTIDPDLCDGCGVCSNTMVCPFGAISKDGGNGS